MSTSPSFNTPHTTPPLILSSTMDVETAGKQTTAKPSSSSSSLFRYNSPLVQVILIGLVCLCVPAMFDVVTGMGGGGQTDTTVVSNANTALYTTFAVFSVLAGGIYNIAGPRIILFASCSAYILYAGSFLCYNHYQHQSFTIAAGVILGVGSSLLWAVQGAMMMSYPPANRKGSYISLFWCIFSMGSVIGGWIPFGLNYRRGDTDATVTDSTYIGFMAFMTIGTLLTLAILPPRKVVRDDGSSCTNIKYSSVSIEIVEISKLFLNWKMLLIVPAAWTSNFYYTYQYNNVNGVLFNLRTRGLNSVMYWVAEIFSSMMIAYVFDFSSKSRRTRGLAGIGVAALLGTGVWAGGLVNQLGYSRDDQPRRLDFKDSGSAFVGPFALFCSYGFVDAMFQSMIYWVIGALANDSETLSRYTGFFKGLQSAGAAVAWQIDSRKVPYLNQLIVNWVMTTVSYPLLAALVLLAVKDEHKVEGETNSSGADFSPAIPASKSDADGVA